MMTTANYIVDFLIQKGVTDVFGLPGGVVLDFLYALHSRQDEIKPHLNYHEQCAAFAACGYAQTSGRLGVAYATRGPGLTNMITGIVDAYHHSTPVLFITAHTVNEINTNMRISMNQELDTVSLLSSVVKYIARVDRLEDVQKEVEYAYLLATTGRKGPVLLDFSEHLFSQELEVSSNHKYFESNTKKQIKDDIEQTIVSMLKNASRPIFLIGDGIRQSNTMEHIKRIVNQARIPVLSSRCAQDIMQDSKFYFGYIGSHGIRYSNFILSKADLIIIIGNRAAFPIDSLSYRPILEKSKIIRIDVDEGEFSRKIPNSVNFNVDIADLLPEISGINFEYVDSVLWIKTCNELKNSLYEEDTDFPVKAIADVLKIIDCDTVVVSDVGNHEFWVSRAYTYSGISNRVLYSKTFGTLGCAIPKGIGAYFATRKPVVCFVGDQGFQLNIQELQFIFQHQLPITIVLLNNASSGMIRTREKKKYKSHFVHTTITSGYSFPNFDKIATVYGLDYAYCSEQSSLIEAYRRKKGGVPCLLELRIDEETDVHPNLPKGNKCQKLTPLVSDEIYTRLDNL